MLPRETEEQALTEEIVEEELAPTDLEDAVDNIERVVPAIVMFSELSAAAWLLRRFIIKVLTHF